MDCIVYRVAKSRTRLIDFQFELVLQPHIGVPPPLPLSLKFLLVELSAQRWWGVALGFQPVFSLKLTVSEP